eukprot:TRINITY_DN1767_c0_g1_i4.p1 TRINITY_DN1767_c0_g1~~TRINITY_DN1767_c0_g1_i4.p1  ORF type:complete len:809 (+),score=184.95 TRINITY_DN1767_c0_g1_i4:215-2641(+)
MSSMPNINLWIGPYGSSPTSTVADAVQKAASPKVLIGTGATSSSLYICPSSAPSGCEPGARRFSRLFSPLSIAERYYVPAVNIFRTKGAKTVGIVYETSAFGTSLALGSKAEAINNKLNITLEQTCPPTPNAGNVSLLVDSIIQANPDVVICGLYYAASVEMIKQFKARNFVPKAFVSRMGDVALFNDLGRDASYSIDSNYWDSRLRGDDYIDTLYFPPSPAISSPAPRRWADAFAEVFGFQPGGNYEGVSFVAGEVLHRAIERARSWDPVRVQQALSQIQFTSFWGKITFNGFGYNELYPFTQVQYNDQALSEIIYPLIASTQDTVYPIPLWEERSQRLYAYWQMSEKAIVGLAGIFMILTFAMMLFVVILSNRHRVIKAASPPFLLLFLFGSLLLYTGVIMWSLYVPTAVCNAVAWCLSVGFVVMFGSLFGRTFRILQIIKKSKYAPVKFTNKRLLVFVSLLVAVDVIVLIIWTSVVPIRGVFIQPDRYRPLQDIVQCTLQSSDYIFIGILGAYKLLIMCAGLFFSVKIWNFRLSEFNESKPIAFGQYNLIFFMILAIVAVAVFDPVSQRIASYVLRSVAIMLATFIAVLVIMIPKIYAVYKIPPGTESSRRPKMSVLMSGIHSPTGTGSGSGTNTSSHTNSKSFSSMSESELEARLSRMTKDLERVKADNKRLEAENTRLKKQLALAAEEESTEESSEEKKDAVPKKGTDESDATEPSSSSEEKVKKSAASPKMKKDDSKASSKNMDEGSPAEEKQAPEPLSKKDKKKKKQQQDEEKAPESSSSSSSTESSESEEEKKPKKKGAK